MSSNTNLNYVGTIIHIGETEQVSEKFSKRIVVVSDKTSEYPQEIQFEFNQSKCSELDSFLVGSLVDLSYNLRGRAWTNPQGVKVWFNTLNAWKISKVKIDSGSHNETTNNNLPY